MKYRSKYTKEEMKEIIAELLASGRNEAALWSAPKGVNQKHKETVTLNITRNEFVVIKQLAKKFKMGVADMFKRILIAYFFKSEGCVADLAGKINQDTMQKLFGYAVRKVDDDVKEYKKPTKKKRGRKRKKDIIIRRQEVVDGKRIYGKERVRVKV